MVCDVCGTRNLGAEARCLRCGARLPAPHAEAEVAPEPERDWTPGERLAIEARDQLAAGDASAALRAAQRAAVVEPNTFLCRLVLGETYLALDADADALREFRRAAEIDPDSGEAKEKAELARRRLTHPHERPPTPPQDWRGWVRLHRRWVAIAAGVVTGLLVFTVGAAAIVSRTSPAGQLNRLYQEQMRLGSEHSRAGRYEQAATAFEQAWRLKPQSAEAKRRLDDALANAGLAPYPTGTPPGPIGPQVASISPANNISPFLPRHVGPTPSLGADGRPPTPPYAPPPTVDPGPPPAPQGPGPQLPPPIPPQPTAPDVVDNATGPPRNDTPPAAIGAPPPEETTPPAPTDPPPQGRKSGRIVLQVHGPRPATGGPTPAPQPKPPSPDALRAEADRLRATGNHAAAGRKYEEAGARYREEAARGGPGAATQREAANVCDAARKLCDSQGN
jgi:tetratricopeptide (TPR) repeat protein